MNIIIYLFILLFINSSIIIESNRAKAISLGVISLMINILNTHVNNESVCQFGCCVLWNVSENNLSVKKEICDKGGLAIISLILGAYQEKQELVETCCGAIGSILSSPETRSAFFSQEIVDLVKKSGEKYAESEEIKKVLAELSK